MAALVITDDIAELIERLVEESKTGSYGQPLGPDEARLAHNNAQRSYIEDTAYALAAAVRHQRGEQ